MEFPASGWLLRTRHVIFNPFCQYFSKDLFLILFKDCGRSVSNIAQQVGESCDETKSFPWHASIYEFKGGKYELTCGGTLISSKTVISAAQCFAEDDLKEERTELKNSSIFRVAVGKKYAYINESEDTLAQIKQVNPLFAEQQICFTLLSAKFFLGGLCWDSSSIWSISVPICWGHCIYISKRKNRIFICSFTHLYFFWGRKVRRKAVNWDNRRGKFYLL